MSLRAFDPDRPEPNADALYQLGEAAIWLAKNEQEKLAAVGLAGRLYVAKSGWLLLSVPNALVRGIYAALTATGAELPRAGALNVPHVDGEVLNAHIAVMTADEVAKIGADKINERGRMFGYTLGQLKEITPRNIDGVSKLWVLQVTAPDLAAIRKSYGLSSQLNEQPFHITVALRRKGVLQENSVSKFDAATGRGEAKQAAADATTYDCSCSGKCMCPPTCVCKRYCGQDEKTAGENLRLDLTRLAPKWGDRQHLLAALPKHLDDTRAALAAKGDVDKEMTDLALIAQAWLKTQKQKELLAARLKKFQETAAYPSLAAPKTAAVYNFEGDVQGVSLRKTLHQVLDELKHPGVVYNNARTGEARAVIPGDKKRQREVLDLLRFYLASRPGGKYKSKTPLREGVDYKITPLPGQKEKLRKVLMTPDDVQNFIRQQGFNRLAAENPDYQKQWLSERYRLKLDDKGQLQGSVPELAKQQLFHGEPVYNYQLTPGWNDENKAAAADPQKTILVSGHSGAGKSTLSKVLAEKLKMPLISADKHPEFEAFFSKPGRVPGAETIPGTPEYAEFQLLRRRVGEDVLASSEDAAVIEGIQLSALPSEQLRRYKQRVYVQTPIKQLLRQRFERQRNKATQKGNPWPEEELKSRYEIGRKIYDAQKQLMDRYAKLPGTVKYRPYKDDVDALIARLKSAGDKLPGGAADGAPDSQFPRKALAEGAKHEHEHTDDDQIAEEIAKDHLSEDPAYYKKQEKIEKAGMSETVRDLRQAKEHSDAKRYDQKRDLLRRLMQKAPQDWEIDDDKPKYKGVTHKPTKFKFHTDPTAIPEGVRKKIAQSQSVYWDQLKNMVTNPRIVYDHTKPVFENIRNHMLELKQRGDWIMRSRRNEQIYRAQVDPQYRHQLALQAFEGRMPQPSSYVDQLIERYGDHFMNLGASK